MWYRVAVNQKKSEELCADARCQTTTVGAARAKKGISPDLADHVPKMLKIPWGEF
jgi:hypothetical protein